MIWVKIFRGAIAAVILIQLCDYTGLFTHLLEADYSTYYGSVLQETLSPNENHSWDYYSYLLNPSKQCEKDVARLTIVVKTAIQNKERRNAIRRTWGNKKRFSDVVIRIFFVVGKSSNEFLMNSILQEHQKESDVIQADFLDSYYNNTIKTILGFRWLLEFCPLSEYFLFVDDDYIVSVKNVLRFINMCKKKTHDVLFSGFVMQTSPHRHKFSKWYISLREYPFDKWPPYATAGAYILSKTALAMLYSTALKIPKFKFDDIYLGMLAYQANMTLHHCDKFYFVKPHYYGPHSFRNILASHGYESPKEMESVWTDCRSAGYA